MVCCALAVFLLGQLYGAIAWVRGRMGLDSAKTTANAASSWRPEGSVEAPALGSRASFRPAAFVYLASFAALGAAIVGFSQTTPEDQAAHVRAMLSDPIHWCGHALTGQQ